MWKHKATAVLGLALWTCGGGLAEVGGSRAPVDFASVQAEHEADEKAGYPLSQTLKVREG